MDIQTNMIMQTKITAWGNSLGVRIPKEILTRLNLGVGSEIKFIPENRKITILPIQKKEKIKLKDLVSLITENNRHDSILWSSPVGNEIW